MSVLAHFVHLRKFLDPTDTAGLELSPGEGEGWSLSPGEGEGWSLSPGEGEGWSLLPGEGEGWSLSPGGETTTPSLAPETDVKAERRGHPAPKIDVKADLRTTEDVVVLVFDFPSFVEVVNDL